MFKRNLIAAVVIAAYVAGVRKNIQPGEPVPEIPEHDQDELLESGAIVDLDRLAADDERRARVEALQLSAFAAAREKVARETESQAAPGPQSTDQGLGAPVVFGVDLASGDSVTGLSVVGLSGDGQVVVHSTEFSSGGEAVAGTPAAPVPVPDPVPPPPPEPPAPAPAPPAPKSAPKPAKGKTAR